jgi:glycosyltransferase involved in cell wall biosynthesis
VRAAVYNPYLDTLGGGERYTLGFAGVLVENGFSVDLQWKNSDIKKVLETRFGVDLSEINIVNDIKKGDDYDLCFWVSDGSTPLLRARKNILHFQVPFHDVGGRSLLNKMKLIRINEIICNSNFTKKIIDYEYGVDSVVIYPPVDVENIKPKRKENIILSVGRFSQLEQSKGQDVLVRVFRKLYDGGLRDWKLVLAGGVEVGVGDFLERLKRLATGYPIEIIESPEFKTIKGLFGTAKIFWSASGFGENEEKNPEKVEHFGISVVEAMAGGAVPVIYKAGGHKEIVSDRINGFLWEKKGELGKKTKLLIGDKILYRKLALSGIKVSKKFGYERFESDIKKIL